MRQIWIGSCNVMSGACLALLLSGCISIPNSPTPRFYKLQAADENQINRPGKRIDTASDVIIGIGPIKIPGYQNRPQIVTQGKDNLLEFAQFDRWGESLDLGVMGLIGEGLTVLLPGEKITSYPWNPSVPAKYQLIVEIVQLDSKLDKDLFLVAQWLIIDLQNTKTLIIKRSEFRQPIIPQDYAGLTKTLSTACALLTKEIAEAFATLELRPKTEEKNPSAESRQ